MKKLLVIVGVLIGLSSCVSTHEIAKTPTTEREAIIYDDHVVIITRTKLSKEQFRELSALTDEQRKLVK